MLLLLSILLSISIWLPAGLNIVVCRQHASLDFAINLNIASDSKMEVISILLLQTFGHSNSDKFAQLTCLPRTLLKSMRSQDSPHPIYVARLMRFDAVQ